MAANYGRIAWTMTRARTPAPQRAAIHNICLHKDAQRCVGPVGRALRTMQRLGWERGDEWWEWRVPGIGMLRFHIDDLDLLKHHVREAIRLGALKKISGKTS